MFRVPSFGKVSKPLNSNFLEQFSTTFPSFDTSTNEALLVLRDFSPFNSHGILMTLSMNYFLNIEYSHSIADCSWRI
jgi:hypothetical protein